MAYTRINWLSTGKILCWLTLFFLHILAVRHRTGSPEQLRKTAPVLDWASTGRVSGFSRFINSHSVMSALYSGSVKLYPSFLIAGSSLLASYTHCLSFRSCVQGQIIWKAMAGKQQETEDDSSQWRTKIVSVIVIIWLPYHQTYLLLALLLFYLFAPSSTKPAG